MTLRLLLKHSTSGLLAAVLLLSATGCAVVSLKVEGPSALRTETREAIQQNGNGRAATLLQQATQSKAAEPTRIAALLEAIELTASARPGTAPYRLNRSATENLVAIMQARAFVPVVLPDGRTFTVAGDSAKTLDPRSADELVAASALEIKRLRVRNTQDGVGAPY
ncbi:MAG: hypothetical protein WEC72_01340, partial [Chthoniobacterales bacterium]